MSSPTSVDNSLAGFISYTIGNLQEEYVKKTPRAKQRLAAFRQVGNRSIGESPETWDVLYSSAFPEKLIGRGSTPTKSETAAFLTLTLYAVHQQSKDKGVHVTADKGKRPNNLGAAVRQFATLTDTDLFESSLYRRFNSVVQSQTIESLAYHLRSLIKLLRSEDIVLDYVLLAKDLYNWQDPERRKAVQLNWARQLYHFSETPNS